MILLDTHVLVWSQREPRKLSRLAEAAIRRARASRSLAVSVITVVELASLMNRGRIRTAGPMEGAIRQLLEEVEVLPLSLEAAINTSHFPIDSLPDPMDRMIVATAQLHEVPLVTADERIINCAWIRTIW